MVRFFATLSKTLGGRSLASRLAKTCGLAVVVLLGTFALSPLASALTESTIYSFTQTDSFWPEGGLVEDASGNLYGTTAGGGTYGAGTVYQLSPPAQGVTTWTKTVLWNFQTWGSTGYVPSSELAIDNNGALYGVTWSGGDASCHCGVLYQLVPPVTKGGAWTQLVLHAFTNTGNDGRLPNTPVVLSSTASYGATSQGGLYDSGVVYQLIQTGGKTTYSVLYSFGADNDAGSPSGPLLLDSAGNLYGVTASGGTFNAGAVYKLSPPQGGGSWTESILFSFGGGLQLSGITPMGNLLFDSLGNLYGVTEFGGSLQGGVVYQLTPASGSWTQTLLFNFYRAAGEYPLAGLTWNPTNGSLYGTASSGNMIGTPSRIG